jgi:hypothetical protein
MSAQAPAEGPGTGASEHMSRTFFARIKRGNNLTKCGAKTNPRDTAMLIAAQARACVDCPTLQVVGPQSTNQVQCMAPAASWRQAKGRIHTWDRRLGQDHGMACDGCGCTLDGVAARALRPHPISLSPPSAGSRASPPPSAPHFLRLHPTFSVCTSLSPSAPHFLRLRLTLSVCARRR